MNDEVTVITLSSLDKIIIKWFGDFRNNCLAKDLSDAVEELINFDGRIKNERFKTLPINRSTVWQFCTDYKERIEKKFMDMSLQELLGQVDILEPKMVGNRRHDFAIAHIFARIHLIKRLPNLITSEDNRKYIISKLKSEQRPYFGSIKGYIEKKGIELTEDELCKSKMSDSWL